MPPSGGGLVALLAAAVARAVRRSARPSRLRGRGAERRRLALAGVRLAAMVGGNETAGGGAPLRVLQWNVFLRAEAWGDAQETRAAAVGAWASQAARGADAVALCEMHHPRASAAVADALTRAGFAHSRRLGAPDDHRAAAVCGGVEVFSRWPLPWAERVQFRAAAWPDSLAAKGALVCLVDRPADAGGAAVLAATHTQAGSGARAARARLAQARQLRAALDAVLRGGAARPPGGVTVAGDLNEDLLAPSQRRAALLEALGAAATPAPPFEGPPAFDPAGNQMVGAERWPLPPCLGCSCPYGGGEGKGGAGCDAGREAWYGAVLAVRGGDAREAPPAPLPLRSVPASPCARASDHHPVTTVARQSDTFTRNKEVP